MAKKKSNKTLKFIGRETVPAIAIVILTIVIPAIFMYRDADILGAAWEISMLFGIFKHGLYAIPGLFVFLIVMYGTVKFLKKTNQSFNKFIVSYSVFSIIVFLGTLIYKLVKLTMESSIDYSLPSTVTQLITFGVPIIAFWVITFVVLMILNLFVDNK